jgi:hypothetical protein
MIERVGRGGRAQRMGTDLKAELRGIAACQPINTIRSNGRA